MTKDEKLLLEIYKKIREKGDFNSSVDPLPIGKELGYKDHLIKNILRGLMQANLLKKYSENEIALTERGKELAKELSS